MKNISAPQTNATACSSGAGGYPATNWSGGHPFIASETENPFRETRYGWLVVAVVWVACATYLAVYLHEGWVPHDAGMLAEMAARVLHGQVPYRNFIEVYTGGLTCLNALALRLFGLNFFSLRIPLFLFFLGWVPAVYFIARRFSRPLAAGAVILLAVAWSVPNYPEAMPSWYNLFFATWGLLALLRFTESERKRWLWIAGLCGGLSFLVKISALYFVAAGLLFFIFREQSMSRNSNRRPQRSGIAYKLFVTAGLVCFFILLAGLVLQRPTLSDVFQFLVPSGCLVALLEWQELGLPSSASVPRFRKFFAMALPFLTAVLVPPALFLLWFVKQGAALAWLNGVFVRSALHLRWAGFEPLPLIGLLGLLPVLAVVPLAYDSAPTLRRLARYGVPLWFGIVLLACWKSFTVYELVGFSLPLLVPLLALTASGWMIRSSEAHGQRRQKIFLVVASAVTMSLIQFPFSMILYFCFVAPLLILAVLALWSVRKCGNWVVLGSVLGFYLLFALWLHTPGFFISVNGFPGRPLELRTIALKRAGGIRAPEKLAREYEDLIELIRKHASGPYIYATPDCPEVYFLSGLHNPTGTIYDFLDPDYLNPQIRKDRILSAIALHGVHEVVLGPGDNSDSGVVSPALRRELVARFPESARAGRFEVRWKP